MSRFMDIGDHTEMSFAQIESVEIHSDRARRRRTPRTSTDSRVPAVSAVYDVSALMYISKQNSFWTVEESNWLHGQAQDSEVRVLVKLVGGKHEYGNAANEMCKRFKVRFPEPRRGETSEEFWLCKKKHHGTYELHKWPADTDKEHKERMNRLKMVCVLGECTGSRSDYYLAHMFLDVATLHRHPRRQEREGQGQGYCPLRTSWRS